MIREIFWESRAITLVCFLVGVLLGVIALLTTNDKIPIILGFVIPPIGGTIFQVCLVIAWKMENNKEEGGRADQ